LSSGRDWVDDRTIPDTEELLRRIARDWIVTRQDTGEQTLSSQAFRSKDKEISVDLRSELPGDSVREAAKMSMRRGGPRIVGVVTVTAGLARRLNQVVMRDPTPEDSAHALICGQQPRSVLKALADGARWVLLEDG
jgi:hypothetical protein